MYFVELVINGIAVGSLYALIALGFVLIYKGTGVINFAQGEAIMVAAFVAYYLVTKFGFPFWLAIPSTLVAVALLGAGTERLIIRPMLGEPVFSVVMVTIGLSIFLRAMSGIVFGHHNYIFPNPFPTEPLKLGGIVLSHIHLWSMIISGCLMAAFALFFINAGEILNLWQKGIRIMVYLKADTSEAGRLDTKYRLQTIAGVQEARYISKAEASQFIERLLDR